MEPVRRKVNAETLQQILDCFVELTGIRAAYYDESEELVSGLEKPVCSFCSQVKHVPQLQDGCRKSDITAYHQAIKTKQLYIYTCHMGLWEAVVPVYAHGIFAGYLMFGQVKNNRDQLEQWAGIEKKLLKAELPAELIEEIRRSFDEVQEMGYEKVCAVARMLEIIARHIIDTDVIRICDLQAIEKAKLFIEQHFNEPISTRDVAHWVQLSPSYVSALFSGQTNTTITSYIALTRINHAKKMLQGSASVKEIAFCCGFTDQNYFSRVFKQVTGLNPLKYRDTFRA